MSTLKKIWNFLWHDDSLASWIVSAVLAFLIVKFLIFPGLGLLLQTDYPVVAVVSGSMEHKTTPYSNGYHACGTFVKEKEHLNFDEFWDLCRPWYEENSISKETFQEFSFQNGFNTGDIMVLVGTPASRLELGDVIVFNDGRRRDPIIHRIVHVQEINGTKTFQTKGDHNAISDVFESNIQEEHILGRAVFRIPWLGYVKIIAVKLLNTLMSFF